MRQVWLGLLLAFALATSGAASAAAAIACSVETQAFVAEHDCCPHGDKHNKTPQQKDMDRCMLAGACGALSAVTPGLARVQAPIFVQMHVGRIEHRLSAYGSQLAEYWRPPRTL